MVAAHRHDLSAREPLTLSAVRSPFGRDAEVRQVPPGATLQEIVDAVLDGRTGVAVRAYVDGHAIYPRHWRYVRPRPGKHVYVRVVPHGGDGKAGGILSIIVGIGLVLLTAVTFGAGAVLGGAAAAVLAGEAGALGALSLSVAGIAAITSGIASVLAPPPTTPYDGDIRESRDSPALAGALNGVRRFAPVPRVFGRCRRVPEFATKPYTEIVGGDTFLRAAWCIGKGPLEITDIKVGETPIAELTSEYRVLKGWDDDPTEFLYATDDVDETALAVDLEITEQSIRTTESDTHTISVDFLMPEGLIGFDRKDGHPYAVTLTIVVEYRRVGANPWLAPTFKGPFAPGVTDLGSGFVTISAAQRGLTVRGLQWDVSEPGEQFEVRVTYQGAAPSVPGDTQLDAFRWGVLRSIRPGGKPLLENGAYVEARIKTTDQLAGLIRDFNCIAESYVEQWTEIDGWGSGAILDSNPAWILSRAAGWHAALLLRRIGKVPDERIDAASFADLALKEVAQGRNVDAILDTWGTVGEWTQQVLAHARASITLKEHRYAVSIEEPKPLVKAMFNPRNSSNWRTVRRFRKPIHAFKVWYTDPETWQPTPRFAYADGFDESNATEFEELRLPFQTDPDVAWQDGRFHWAAGQLQPFVHSLDTDFEMLGFTRGDRIAAQHDVILVGLSSARITSPLYDGQGRLFGAFTDETFPYDGQSAYAVRIRDPEGGLYLKAVSTFPEPTNSFLLIDPLETGGAPQPSAGSLVSFGVSGKVDGDYLVHRITQIADLRARVELIDYDPAIYTADQGPIPPFDPGITIPTPPAIRRPAEPVIDDIFADERALTFSQQGTAVPRIVARLGYPADAEIQIDAFQGSLRVRSPQGEWITLPPVDARTKEAALFPVDEGVIYDVRFRSITEDGRASAWTATRNVLVTGSANPPPDPTNGRVDPPELMVWDYPDRPTDFLGFLVRHQAGSDTIWQSGIPAHDGVITETRFDFSRLPAGQRTIMVRAIDRSGNLSTNFTFVVVDVDGPPVENVIASEDFHSGGFTGTKTNGTVEGGSGDLVADTDSDGFWTNDTSSFWMSNDAALFWTDVYLEMTYVDSWMPGVSGILRITAAVAGNAWSLEYREQGSSTWLSWPGFVNADDATTYEIRVTTAAGNVQGRISALLAFIDVPDVDEIIEDFTVAATGTVRVPITKTYQKIQTVSFSLQDDGNGGVQVIVLDKSASLGPSIKVVDDTNSRVAGLIDAVVQGY